MGSALGQGSLGLTPRSKPATAPTILDANNGLSLSGTDVQLGQDVGAVGDPASLLNDREIPMDGFDLHFAGSLIGLSIYDSLGNASIDDIVNGAPFLFIDIANQYYSIGDDWGVSNGCELYIAGQQNKVAATVVINGALNRTALELLGDPTNTFSFGDCGNNQNGSKIVVDDNNKVIKLFDSANDLSLEINGTPGFTGTVANPTSITVISGIVTAVS